MKYKVSLNFWQHEESILWMMLVFSMGIHLALFNLKNLKLPRLTKQTIEIDLTNAVRRTQSASHPAQSAKIVKPKEWVKPTPDQVKPYTPPPTPVTKTEEEQPVPNSGGEVGLSQITRLPQLLNLSDLEKILQRLYPEEERSQAREAIVVLDLHLDTNGKITSVDIVQSGGAAFDQAAQRAAKLLRFTPAFLGTERVPVKIRQAIQFKLES